MFSIDSAHLKRLKGAIALVKPSLLHIQFAEGICILNCFNNETGASYTLRAPGQGEGAEFALAADVGGNILSRCTGPLQLSPSKSDVSYKWGRSKGSLRQAKWAGLPLELPSGGEGLDLLKDLLPHLALKEVIPNHPVQAQWTSGPEGYRAGAGNDFHGITVSGNGSIHSSQFYCPLVALSNAVRCLGSSVQLSVLDDTCHCTLEEGGGTHYLMYRSLLQRDRFYFEAVNNILGREEVGFFLSSGSDWSEVFENNAIIEDREKGSAVHLSGEGDIVTASSSTVHGTYKVRVPVRKLRGSINCNVTVPLLVDTLRCKGSFKCWVRGNALHFSWREGELTFHSFLATLPS